MINTEAVINTENFLAIFKNLLADVTSFYFRSPGRNYPSKIFTMITDVDSVTCIYSTVGK